MNILSRLKFPALALVGAFLVYAFLLAVHYTALAHGAAMADPVGPTSVSAATLDDSWAMFSAYGPIWGGMAVTFGVVSWLLKRNDSQHWIAQGRTLAIIVGGLGIVAAVLDAKFAGAPLAGIAMTAIAALFKLINPAVTPPAAKLAPAKESVS